MKISRWIITITLCMVILYGVAILFMFPGHAGQMDPVEINEVARNVEAEFQDKREDIVRDGIYNQWNYRIILLQDKDYEFWMNHAIQYQETVTDLWSQDQIAGKIVFLNDHQKQKEERASWRQAVSLITLCSWLMICAVVTVLYIHVIRPFQSMQSFARRVAQGDLDFRVKMNKRNYFGAFTESFDLMREELKRARTSEYQANISKKELVAELSHDIKTPIATIKAICELLEAKWMEESRAESDKKEKEKEKIAIIYQKADMVDQLISNMFHATLEELEVLRVEPQEMTSFEIREIIEKSNFDSKIHLLGNVPECLIYGDRLRISQVIDNVISNSYKYAGTDIDVSFFIDAQDHILKIKIKDYGEGVPEAQLPLVCQKYFRGEDEKVRRVSGSGLGLYLARRFMEQMQGTFECYNENGFAVEIGLRVL